MAADLATLGIRIENTQAIAAATATGAALDKMGASGTRASVSIEQGRQAWARSGGDMRVLAQELQKFQAASSPVAAAVTTQATAFHGAARAATGHGLQLGKVAKSLEVFAIHAVGANHQLALFGAAMAHAQIGTIGLTAALAGVAAGIFIWKAWTEAAHKAKDEQGKLVKSLLEWHEKQKAALSFAPQIRAMKDRIVEMRKSVDDLGTGFSMVGAHASKAMAWIRVLTAGSPAAMYRQYWLEVAKGLSATNVATKAGEDAIRAARAEDARKANEIAKQSAENSADQLKALEDEIALVGKAGDARNLLIAQQLRENLLIEANRTLTGQALADRLDAIQKIVAATLGLARLTDAEEKKQKAIAEAAQRMKTMLESIQHTFRDFFVDLFEHGLSSLRGFIDSFKTLFLRMIADILASRLMARLGGVLGAAVGTASTAGAQTPAAVAGAGISTMGLVGIGLGIAGVAGIAMSFLDAGKRAAEAAKRVREFNDALGEFSNTTATDLARAIEAVRKQAAQLRTQAAEMFLKAPLVDIQAYLAALAQINLAEAQRILQLVKSAEALRLAAQQDLEVRLLRAKGLDAEADAMAFALEQQREYAKAVLDNADALYLATLAEVQRAEAIARSMAKVQGVIDGLTNTINGLQGFADTLKLSPSLSPVDRLAEARRQYEAVLAAAQAGDQAAAGRLPAAAQAFLDASQAVNASGGAYAADYARVLADTEATIKLFEDAKSIQQQILDVLKEQLGLFKSGGIGDTIFGDGGGVGVGGGFHHGPSAAEAERMHQEELTEIRASVRLLAVAGEKLDRIDASVNGVTGATRRGFEGLTLLT